MPYEDFERENAKEWDASTVATETPCLEDLESNSPSGFDQFVDPRTNRYALSPRGRPRAGGRGRGNSTLRGGSFDSRMESSNQHVQSSIFRGRNTQPVSRNHSSSYHDTTQAPLRPKYDLDNRAPRSRTLVARPIHGTGIGKAKNWGKTNLVSAKTSEALRLKAVEDARGKQFMGQPSADDLGHFGAIGYFLWPYPFDEGSSPSNILGLNLSCLHDIRKRFETFIDWDQSLHCIRLRSWNEDNTENALCAVSIASRHANASFGVENRDIKKYVVRPPTTQGWKAFIEPRFSSDSLKVVGDMRIVSKVSMTGRALTSLEEPEWITRRDNIRKEQQIQVEESLTDILYRMQPLRCGMKMRVNFGHTTITKYKKDFADCKYSYDEFSKMIASTSRLMTTFEKNLGNGQDAAEMIKHVVSNGRNMFTPARYKFESLNDVEAEHQLVLFARSRESEKSDLIRVECEIESSEPGFFQAGTTHFFLHDKQIHRLGFHSMDMESNFDWCLQLSTTDECTSPPKILSDYVANSVLSDWRGVRIDEQGDEYPSVMFKDNYLFDIEGVLLRSVRSYAISDTPGYVLDITVFRRWVTSDTRDQPQVSLGLSISCKEWDHDLKTLYDDASRTWYSSLKGLVDDEQKEDSGFEGFMDQIEHVHKFLDAAKRC